MGINFHYKVICDNVHGSIGISALEQNIINTRTFQRLKKIKQLGLASLVFPGAEHSRFAHSIGVMHLMSKMVDRLREEGCEYVKVERVKQKLRLAALLHDIGHYPLAHLGEQVFLWVDQVDKVPQVVTQDKPSPPDQHLLLSAAYEYKSGPAKHESLGKLILCSDESEIHLLVKKAEFDPAEIARIFNSEDKENPFYIQLMSSTLDCDRMDFLLRDSLASGTNFGHVDVNYILRNLTWDPESKFICFQPKAINAIEHFITGRYFSYNVTYHKTVMGFELMAKVLFFAMMRDKEFKEGDYGEIVRSFDDVEDKIKTDWTFLANFNDEYFWYYLDRWRPSDPIEQELRHNLLSRVPLRVIYEAKVLHTDPEPKSPYYYLASGFIDSVECQNCLRAAGVDVNRLAVKKEQVTFEKVPYSVRYDQDVTEENRLKLVKVVDGGQAKDLVSYQSSIVQPLSRYQPSVARLYALVEKGSDEETRLKEGVNNILDKHGPRI